LAGLKELAEFLYGKKFWYMDPLREVDGLTEEQMFWVPNEVSLPIIWQVGHIAHRELLHLRVMIQGHDPEIIPESYRVFDHRWHSVGEIMESIGSVESVLEWVSDVRKQSLAFIDSLEEDDWHRVPDRTEGLSVAHWVFITSVHSGVHIGRIQSLRAIIEGKPERAC
jgi:hypothetical protein